MSKADNNASKDRKDREFIKVPWPMFIGQWGFLALMCILSVVQLPMGPFGLPWNTFILSWVSFLVLLVTSFYWIYVQHQKAKKHEEEN